MGSVDEDAGNYEYDYAPDNGLGPTVELGQGIRREPESRPPPSRLAPAPKRQSFKPRPNTNDGYRPRNRAPTGLIGKESCKSGAKSVGHESACDLYYDCYEGQGFLQSCPNGLVFGGDGRFGLVGECDYPHNVNCQIRHRALSTATGSTASLATRLPARATGPAGTARQPSSSALAGSFTTRRPTPATGPRMWPAARSILCARMTQTAMCPLASPATDTGHARAATRVFSVVPPCLCSTRIAGAA